MDRGGEEGQIEAEAHLQRLPLNIANGFITDRSEEHTSELQSR